MQTYRYYISKVFDSSCHNILLLYVKEQHEHSSKFLLLCFTEENHTVW